MKTIKPPASISKNHRRKILVFLAGSIEMGQADNWQLEVEEYLKDQEDYTILNPRRDNWDSSLEQSFENPGFYQQVNWELSALQRADIIIMYLVPETKSPVSLLELGLYADSGKILVCCPEGFWRKGNIEIVCEKYAIPLFESMNELLAINFSKA